MDLLVMLQNSVNSGLLWSAVSGRQLGRLEPCTYLALQLSMVAIRTGLLVHRHTLSVCLSCVCVCVCGKRSVQSKVLGARVAHPLVVLTASVTQL